MRKLIVATLMLCTLNTISAQIQTPKLSPLAKVEQKVGLTDIKIEYSRPKKNNREIFGELVPFNVMWRTGANENSKFTCSDAVIFGKDTLRAGTYALFTKPGENSWEIYFYVDATNWGTPNKWNEEKVALKLAAPVQKVSDVQENFQIAIDNISTNSADLYFGWDKTKVIVPFKVPTETKVYANIDRIMSGPTANDYFAAAEYYYKNNKDLSKALDWSTKAVEISGNDAFWMLRLKSLIEAEMGDYKKAIDTATKSKEAAEKSGNSNYVNLNESSIEEWNKKVEAKPKKKKKQ